MNLLALNLRILVNPPLQYRELNRASTRYNNLPHLSVEVFIKSQISNQKSNNRKSKI